MENEYRFRGTPSSSEVFIISGIHALLEHVEKPVIITGVDFLNNGAGLSPAANFMMGQYNMDITTFPAQIVSNNPSIESIVSVPVVMIVDAIEQKSTNGMNAIK